MWTGAWLRATRPIISRNCCITGERPSRRGARPASVASSGRPPSGRAPSFTALPTSLRSTPRSRGFETKSNAPSFSARTADSTFPCAVMTATGRSGRCSWIQATRSRPSPSTRRLAEARSAAVRVSRLMRLNVRLTSSSRSGSSSTMRTVGLALELIASCYSGSNLPADASRPPLHLPALGIGEHQPKRTAAPRPRLVQQRRAARLGQLAREEQAEARAAALAAEERLEDALRVLRRHAGSAVGDFEKGPQRGGEATVADLDDAVCVVLHSMLDGVVAEVPDDLAQLAGVGAHLDVLVAAREREPPPLHDEPRREPLHRLAELVAEFLDPGGKRQPLEARLLPARELQDVVDDRAHAVGVRADDVREAAVLARESGRLGEELTGVAHRADGVADLVRDARGEPAEGGELRLLHLLGDDARILEEDEDRRGLYAAERREMRPDDPSAVVGHEGLRGVPGRSRVPAPALEEVQQPRGDLAEERAGIGGSIAEDLRRGLVDEADAVLGVHDEDALAQVLDDVLGELREVREVHFLAAGERFALPQAIGDGPDGEADDE